MGRSLLFLRPAQLAKNIQGHVSKKEKHALLFYQTGLPVKNPALKGEGSSTGNIDGGVIPIVVLCHQNLIKSIITRK